MRAAVVTLLLISSGSVLADGALELSNRAAPFAVRDQNPLLAGFGLPTAMPAVAPSQLSGRVDFAWGSTALTQASGNEALLVDAETREVRVTLQGSFTKPGFGWQLQLPYRYTGGGNLDSFIDSWHDTFGLPDGARSALPRDQINIVYTRAGVRRLDLDSSASGIGDIQAAIGHQFRGLDAGIVTAWLTVKLPTGDADKLTGSGGADVSLLLAGQSGFGDRWFVFGQAAATYLSDGDLLPDQQRSVVWSGVAGIGVETWRGLALRAQIDAHTAAYDSDLDLLSEAVVLTIGGQYNFASGWSLDVGVSEDIAVEHSPDVVFILGVKQSW